jgi:hypothetical protein
MNIADKAMRKDDFEQAANQYWLAAHIIPVSGDESVNINGYKIGKLAIDAMQDDLKDYYNHDYDLRIDNDLFRKYLKYLEGK